MTPSVSCVVPVYNGERFLQASVESILAQTLPPHEVIIVDDGSADGTRALVEQLMAASANKMRYLWQTNAGPASARNAGIEASVGEFIAFLDADDLWHPEKIARQLEHFATRPQLGASVTHIQNFWMDEVRQEAEQMQDHPRAKPVAGYISTALMARCSTFMQIGLFDTNLHHAGDTDWFLRAQENHVLVELLADVLTYRRLHLDNRSRRFANRSRAEYLSVLHKSRARQRERTTNEV